MKITVLALVILMAVSLPLQANSWDNPFFSPNLSPNGLLNLNNVQMNHSVSFSSGMSSSGEGFYQSVYTNHLFYRFNPKLDLKVDLNFVNYGTANWDRSFSVSSNNDNASNVIPEFSLSYRPTQNTHIIIEYRQAVHPYSNNSWRW